jgi:hypothetical protein
MSQGHGDTMAKLRAASEDCGDTTAKPRTVVSEAQWHHNGEATSTKNNDWMKVMGAQQGKP